MFELELGVLLIFGIGVFGGILGAWAFQRVYVPQVVGYIAIGVLLGETGLQVIRIEHVEFLTPFNLFALGVIGFLVGGELQFETFRKYGRQYLTIMMSEGVLAFVFVAIPTGIVVYAISRNIAVAAACGVVFGAIASATDPAATVSVLWEYRSKGALTTALIAIVALDDALAMTLYGLGTSAAEFLAGGGVDWIESLLSLAVELLGAVAAGVAGGFLLAWLLRQSKHQEHVIALAVGVLLLVIGLCATLQMDIILAAMALGLVLTNYAPRRSQHLFELMRSFSVPIYAMFFVLVGARLTISNMPPWLWAVVVLYVVGRSAGKYIGSYFGARASGAEPAVYKYCGLGLFAQGGVAVGLSIMASHHLGNVEVMPGLSAGDMIIFAVTATTLLVQIIGPAMAKLAIKRADEAGRNVTEEDVIAEMTVEQVMNPVPLVIQEQTPLRQVVEIFSETEQLIFPVVDKDGAIVGVMRLDAMKDVLPNQDTWDWLVAGDVSEPAGDQTARTATLDTALHEMQNLGLEQMLVVDGGRPVGILDRRHSRRRISETLLHRQQARMTPATEGAA